MAAITTSVGAYEFFNKCIHATGLAVGDTRGGGEGISGLAVGGARVGGEGVSVLAVGGEGVSVLAVGGVGVRRDRRERPAVGAETLAADESKGCGVWGWTSVCDILGPELLRRKFDQICRRQSWM